MICCKCSKEIPDNSKFCGYCGGKQTVKIECGNCHQMVSDEFNFCNHCGSKMSENQSKLSNGNENISNKVATNNDYQNFIYNKTSNENSFVINKELIGIFSKGIVGIVLSIVMAFILFAPISYINLSYLTEIKLDANFSDYISSFIKGIGTFTTDDLSNMVTSQYDLNHTLLIILSDFDNEMLFERIIFYTNFFLILSLFIIPLVNIGLVGYKLYNKERCKVSIKLHLTTLIIVLVVFLLMPLNGFKIGGGLIVYLIINILLVLYDYIDRMIFSNSTLKRNIATIQSLVYSVLIITMFLLALSPVSKTSTSDYFSPELTNSQADSYGVFFQLITYYDDDGIPEEEITLHSSILGPMLVSDHIKANSPWLMYYSLLIPSLTLLIGFLLLRILFIEQNGLYKSRFKKTGGLIIFAIIIAIIRSVIILVFDKYLNAYINDSDIYMYNKIKFSASAFNIVIIFLLIFVFIYYLNYRKSLKKNNYL